MRLRPTLLFLKIVTALFVLAPALVPVASAAPNYKVLHAFTGGYDGGGLWGSLTLGTKGNVYGTTTGTVFELAPRTDGKWDLTTVHRFHYPGKDGSGLSGTLIFDLAGNLYDASQTGGAHGYGVVFELIPHADGWQEKVLYDFPLPGGGCCPYGGLVMDSLGNLYGATYSAFELSRGSNGWSATV
jgi:hypothetical protein